MLPIKTNESEERELGQQVEQLILSSLNSYPNFQVHTYAEIDVKTDLETKKDALGCSQVECATELAGALAADKVIFGNITFVGRKYVLNLTLLKARGKSGGTGVENNKSIALPYSSQKELDLDSLKEVIEQATNSLLAGPSKRSERMILTNDVDPGELLIDTEPPGVSVFLDSQNRGKTPLRLPNISVGVHELTLKLDGYNPLTKDVFVDSNKTTQVKETLSVQRGGILIRSEPTGATCFLDEKKIGTTPCKQKSIPVGIHSLELKLDAYRSIQEEIAVAYNFTTEKTFTLEPAPVNILIGSTPSGAQIRLNDKDMGKTDQSITIEPGQHKLQLFKNGYEDLTESLKVSVGKPQTFMFNLEPGVSVLEREQRIRERIFRWSFTSLAIVSAGAAIWQGQHAGELHNKIEKVQADSIEYEKLRVDGNSAKTISTVASITALISTGLATYFWLTLEF